MLQWYARNHTLACVVPALFIAGAMSTFLSKEAVLRHLVPKARKTEAYSVASVSGTVLAVCSCSVLPMFTGIYRVRAGLGPAAVFLYSGPALNILAIFLTARVLGFQLGLSRALGAIVFGIVLGLTMAMIFRKDERDREAAILNLPDSPQPRRKLWQTAIFFAAMMAFLVFSDWYNPGNVRIRLADGTEFSAVLLQETRDQVVVQVDQITTQMNVGDRMVISKSDLHSVEETDSWVVEIYHSKWYLAGPALSLPSIMVIRSVLGMKKTAVFTLLVVGMATAAGLIYGLLIDGGVI